jgi:hypothetical protein
MAHKPETQLLAEIEDAAEKIEVGADYTHYKDPNKTYTTLGLLVLEATDEIAVRYKANYGAELEFARPVSEWLELISINGRANPRFTKVT